MKASVPLAVLALLATLGPAVPRLAWAAPSAAPPASAPLKVGLAPDPANPAAPRMGDRMSFHTTLRNPASAPVGGVMAWLTILRVDAGHEEAIDLEDWSANKALTIPAMAPGGEARSDWTLRLISPGTYRVLVSAATRAAPVPAVGASETFAVAPKPVVESRRVLPVALGLPLALGGLLALRLTMAKGDDDA
ncbi:hypothetical protein QMO56_19480 [Roseomonas sp. E05]|uniref:hypothetical protein n=1 Tax=Roseomonas sp. E05 TaxID=3046310 RepID=UPI0024B8BCA6|nr:hypothetical protein [Roseomonas sp. E05]MDJ0390297.1 hypothetical protein [Roseomonas sp. E05]